MYDDRRPGTFVEHSTISGDLVNALYSEMFREDDDQIIELLLTTIVFSSKETLTIDNRC